MNKKGFTLVELLAVIVILAVVMLIAVTSVGPMMEKSRKGALGTEGVALVDAAQTAYSAEAMKNSGTAFFHQTDSVCFSIEALKKAGYFEKGTAEGYHGSVLVTRTGNSFTYTFWIGNGTFAVLSATENQSGDTDNNAVFKDYKDTTDNALDKCGGSPASGVKTAYDFDGKDFKA